MKLGARHWVVLALAGACTGLFDGEVHDTRFFEYHQQTDAPELCPGVLDLLDEHAVTMAAEVGLELDPDNPIVYYRFRDTDALLEADACAGAPACASKDAVYTADAFHEHELAHTHTLRAWGRSIGLLEEGEAVSLSCSSIFLDPLNQATALDADWRDFIDVAHGSENPDLGYIAAGRFVTLLAMRYGWESVGRLHVLTDIGSSASDLEETFSALFPESIDAVWAEAMRADATPCMPFARCPSRGPVELGADVTFECDGKPHRVLTVEPQSTVVMTTSDCSFEVISCSRLDGAFLAGCGATVHWLSLPAGDYQIADVFRVPSATVRVEQYDPSPLTASECTNARRVPLDPVATTRIRVADNQDLAWVQIDGGGLAYTVDAGATASLCDACDGAPCVALEGDMVVHAGSMLRIEAADSTDLVRSISFTPLAP